MFHFPFDLTARQKGYFFSNQAERVSFVLKLYQTAYHSVYMVKLAKTGITVFKVM